MTTARNSRVLRIISLLVTICLFSFPAYAKYSGGTGEPNDPYQIATAADLIALGETPEDYDKHFILTADIDLNPNLPGRKVFDKAIIAPDTNDVKSYFQGAPFTGIFDGNGYTISHLTLKGVDYLGFFGRLEPGGEVRNLRVADVNITGSGNYIGGLVGHMGNNSGSVIHCYSTGAIDGDQHVGGLVGITYGGSIIQCYSTCDVVGSERVGGLLGDNLQGFVNYCYSTGEVTGEKYVGGLVGYNGFYTQVIQCYSTGLVNGTSLAIGGLVGYGREFEVVSSFWNVQTSNQTMSNGGIGLTTGEMQDAQTYLDAGWNWVDEIENGTSEVWLMSEEGGYPALAIFSGYTPPQLQGLGTPEEPFLLSDAMELGAIVHYSPEAHYRLTASIDLVDINWNMAVIPWFAGTFDGNNLTISHLTIEGGRYLGLFGCLSSRGKIIDLGIVDVNIAGLDYVGGLVGWHNGKTIGSYSTGIVSGGEQIGGLIGHNRHGDLIQCYSTCKVNGIEAVGGLIGLNYEVTLISESFSAGHVSGEIGVGGLVGISDAIQTWDGGIIINCYSASTVSGEIGIGGIIGAIFGPVDPGFTPWIRPPIPTEVTNCYSTGAVSGSKYVGGLLGSGDSVINSCFWDIEASGCLENIGGGTGKTTEEMQTATTFHIWDGCGVWTIDDGNDYPRLSWENKPGEVIETVRAIDVLMGTGKEDDPFLIYTSEELNMIGLLKCDWDKHFKLMADINLAAYTGTDFNIIGHYVDWPEELAEPFTGVFDGNGHTISNFSYTSRNAWSLGIFGYVYSPSARISNLGLIDPNIDADNGLWIGSLLGHLSEGTITNCFVKGGCVAGDYTIGGLVGYNGGAVTNCYSVNLVSGGNSVGGLVGYNSDTVTACYSASVVSGSERVGGLVGSNNGTIASNYSTGTVSGWKYVGGLVGINWYSEYSFRTGTITTSYSTSMVSGNGYVGGLVGDNDANITSSFWDIETSGQSTSAGGTGKTTAEMQIASTFINAGWDFVGEMANGTEDIWWILEDQDYPRLWWQYGWAFSPYPQDEAVNVSQPLTLSWLSGGSGLYHDVYFGEDKEAVVNATIENLNIYRGQQEPEMTTYNLDTLELEKTYYWRIDEVNEANPNSPWKGDLWCFTTANFIVVDDFESYDSVNPIWWAWKDGLGAVEPYYPGNGTGSVVCEINIDNWIKTIAHSGFQSMTYLYDNDKQGYAYYSEVEKSLNYPRDWTEEGVSELSLWFYGVPTNDPEPMYVAIANRTGTLAVVYHGDPNVTTINSWKEWIIPLQTFADQGINLNDVDRIAIGFGIRGNMTIPGGRGKMYFDDIRLYRPRPAASNDFEVNVP